MTAPRERIGVVLVHGIGEQRRFEHLEGQARLLIEALRRRPATAVSVDILGTESSIYRAEQNSWASGPTVRVGLRDATGYRELLLHEVWWADVNEPYSVAKQIRFWLWGLAVWAYPRKESSTSRAFAAMRVPVVPGYGLVRRFVVRLQLFLIGTIFLMAAFPLAIGMVLAKRLFGLETPDFVQTIVNYVSGVKLYNQRRRYGGALFWKAGKDFLDTLDEPPRVSIRRRMVEAMVAVASQAQPYDRWYVLAHSLGSVVAQNGLMEPAQTLAHYLGREQWTSLCTQGFAGSAAAGPGYYFIAPPGGDPPTPARPAWLASDDVVYRDRVFQNFRGLLTYGSPLEKFAALWPARVAINAAEAHFQADAEWINAYDPVDPVSGVLKAFSAAPHPWRCVPPLRDLGYRTSPWLLYAHLRYLDLDPNQARDLGDATVHWMLDGGAFHRPAPPRPRWFEPDDAQHKARWWLTFFEWIVAGAITVFAGTGAFWAAYHWLTPGWLIPWIDGAWILAATIAQALLDALPALLQPSLPLALVLFALAAGAAWLGRPR